ncbi:MAG: type II/IV secretion system protein [Spirochaetales bacterium]|nr:type II/IV secretion system protein [Spirochaetales bacterium]
MVQVSLSDFKPLPDGEEQYPLEYIENNKVIRLKEDDDMIFIGVVETKNYELLENLKNFHSNKRIIFCALDRNEFSAYLSEKLSAAEAGAGSLEGEQDEKILLDKLANDAPIINLVNSIMIEAIRKGASDIHIEGFEDEVIVRYRIDGHLKIVSRIDRDRFAAVASRLKIMANLNIMEKRLPQDGRISVHLGDDEIDLRVSIIPVANGESIVLRLFNKKKTLIKLPEAGLSKEQLEAFRNKCKTPNGLILVTGPTGSGKTTTLSAVLQEINTEDVKIITIEDPIEYVTKGINQIQTNDRIGLGFDSILRRVLRQDPNIVMVGEIRDTETAELSIRAALTGHLVLSTLHTNDSVSVITRLKNMGIEPYLLAAVLRGGLAQRLVRQICQECKKEVKPDSMEKLILTRYGAPKNASVYIGQGCEACNNTGYKGRIGIFEFFSSDSDVEEMIIRGVKDSDIKNHLVAEKGMKTLIADGIDKVLEGFTTVAEIERNVVG